MSETMVVINNGKGPHGLRDGRIMAPGSSAEVSIEEGKALLDYKHIQDAAKAIPAHADRMAALEKENRELKVEIAKMKAEVTAPHAPAKKGKKDAE